MTRASSRNKSGHILVLALLCLAAVPGVKAGTYYWDVNGSLAGAGDPASGAWVNSGTTWSTDSTGSTNPSPYTTTYNDDLYFVASPTSSTSGDQPYTVTLGSNPVYADSLNFQAAGAATIDTYNSGNVICLGGGSASGIFLPQYAFGTTPNGSVTINSQINLESAVTMSVGTGESLTLTANVPAYNSSYAVTKTGLGTLVFSGLTTNNGLASGLNVLQGTVDFTNSSSNSGAGGNFINVGNANGTSTVGDAATFEMGASTTGVNCPITLNNNGTLITTGGDFEDNTPQITVANGAAATIETLASGDFLDLTRNGPQNYGGSSSSTVTFGGPGVINIGNNGNVLTFAGNYVITGNVRLQTLNALGTNQITVDAGGFLGGSNGSGETANTIILNGGTLGDYDCSNFGGGSITVNAPSYVDNETAGGANYGVNLEENVTLNSNLTFDSVGTTGQYNYTSVTGVLSGTGGITIDITGGSSGGTAAVQLDTLPTYTGVTVVEAGSLVIARNMGSSFQSALINTTVDLAGGTVYWYANGYLPNYMGGLEGSGTLSNTNPNGGGVWGYYIGYDNQSTTFSGAFTGGNNNLNQTGFGITKTGTGTLKLTGNNTGFQEYFAVSAGTLEFANENSLYGDNTGYWNNSYLSVASGATLALGVSGSSGSFTASDISTLLANLDSTSSHNDANGGLLAGSAIGFDTTGGNFTQGSTIGPITDSGGSFGGSVGVTKLGSGTLTLNQANTYTGPTTVVAGTLLVTGSLSGGGAVNVTGGTLGGSGKIAGAVTVSSGATLYPGAAGLAATKLTLASTVTFNTGSTFEVNLDNNGDTADLLAITGNLVLNGSDALTINLLNSAPTVGGNIFEIASYTGTLTGTFASVTPGYQVIYSAGEIEIEAVAIPEPSVFGILAAGAGTMLLVRRRKV